MTALFRFFLVAALTTAILLWMYKEPAPPSFFFKPKSDQPDGFSLFQHEIRTPVGQSSHNYPRGYKFAEMRKAGMIGQARPKHATPLPWLERGPANAGGRTRGLVVDISDATHATWFAGSVGGGIWKTTNRGSSWTNKTPDIPNLATTTLVQAASNPDVLYAGTGEGFFNIGAIDGDGILKSTDHGEMWLQLVSTSGVDAFRNVNRLIVDPANEQIVVAATNTGVLRTTDGGSTWTQTFESHAPVQDLVGNSKRFQTMFAAVNGTGVMRSDDGGVTWRSTAGIVGVHRIELAISPVDTARLFASCEFTSGTTDSAFLFISDNGGITWSRARSQPYQNWLRGQGWYDNTIAAHPFARDTVFVGGINIHKVHVLPGSSSTGGITSIDAATTSDFLAFTNFGLPYLNGGLGLGDDFGDAPATQRTASDYVSVEIRFGPGRHQKAHRFSVGNGGPGVPAVNYFYEDYVDVPFEVWDITNNRRLMCSFRDEKDDGTWDLSPASLDTSDNSIVARDYLFIHAVPYDSNAAAVSIAKDGGMKYKTIYEIGPRLAEDAEWNPSELPDGRLQILWGSVTLRSVTTSVLTDGYNEFGGKNRDVHVDHHNLIVIPIQQASNQFHILNANDGGLSYSFDGGATWPITQADIVGYNTTQFYGLDKKPGSNTYIGGTQDNATWISQQNPSASTLWSRFIGGDGFDAVWHHTNPLLLLASVYNNQIYRSTNGGLSFGLTNQDIMDKSDESAPFITQLGRSKMEPDLIFTTGESGVWRSTNFGKNWALIPMATEWAYSPGGAVFVEISLNNPQIVWTGKRMSSSGSLHLSVDGGRTFAPVAKYPGAEWTISGLAIDPTNDSTAFALFSVAQSPKLLRTTNRGQSWQDLSGFASGSGESANGFPDVAVYSLLVFPNDRNRMWAGTEIGIFETLDGGQSWNPADNGLPAASIWEMWIVDKQVIVATHGRGVWTVELPELPGLVLPPRLYGVRQLSETDVLSVGLRSVYDSTIAISDGEIVVRLGNNTVKDTTFTVSREPGEQRDYHLRSYRNGVYYSSAIVETDSTSGKPPRVIRIAGNYPNPFNAFTTIEFEVGSPGAVSLTVYDMMGRKVRTLLQGEMRPIGVFSAAWDGKNDRGARVSSGVYIIRLSAGSVVRTRKILLVK